MNAKALNLKKVNMFKINPWMKNYWLAILPFGGFMFGRWFDKQETIRMSEFADKSYMYGRKERVEGDYSPWDKYLKQ
ncbi:hypothetical protein JTE90_003771 [Oedothorax gibbosus]|uniref:Complex I-MNLL n=1 Tax=Oedothorax gibbosus TaxID=931172 RepID=A0AAV6VBD5_9ARAC|nr:hypothetical protein JTE90_003771 [Oedothorax gibbosus]